LSAKHFFLDKRICGTLFSALRFAGVTLKIDASESRSPSPKLLTVGSLAALSEWKCPWNHRSPMGGYGVGPKGDFSVEPLLQGQRCSELADWTPGRASFFRVSCSSSECGGGLKWMATFIWLRPGCAVGKP